MIEPSSIGFGFILVMKVNESFFFKEELLSIKILEGCLIMYVKLMFPFLILREFLLS